MGSWITLKVKADTPPAITPSHHSTVESTTVSEAVDAGPIPAGGTAAVAQGEC